MAKLVMFLLCDSINNNPNPKDGGFVPSLVSPCVVLRPAFIPGNFSFGIAAGVRDVNLKDQPTLRFQIFTPNGDIVQDSGEAKLPPIEEEDLMPKTYQGFMINVDVRNMPVPEEGVYQFVLTIGGEQLERQEIPIYRGDHHGKM